MTKTRVEGVRATSPTLLVLIPALNEERTVGDVVGSIPGSIPGVAAVKVVVVDDGSRDATGRVARAAGATVIERPHTGGVGAAFHSGLAHALESGADMMVTLDADGQFDPATIPTLIEPVLRGEADFATASRFKDPALVPDMPRLKLWGNHFMSRLISRLAGQRLWEVSCGMRCYNRESILRLNLLARFTYTQEVILSLAFKELRLAEVPLRVRGQRQHGNSRVANSLWRYGLKTLRIILRSYRDHRPLQFFFGFAAVLLVVGGGLALFLGLHYLQSGAFSPHKWAGVGAGLLLALAVMMAHMGLMGDMLNRHRIYLEELLYRQRKALEGTSNSGGSEGSP